MAIAGKVAITPKGNWSASTAYQKLDLVYYNNGSYVAIQPSTGITPTNTAYWMLVLQSENKADIQSIINGETKVGDADKLDGHNSSYFAKDSDLAIERERITNLATLTEGSTTGDAELADIRVGADGKTYENAGEAVRGQVSDLKSDLSNLNSEYESTAPAVQLFNSDTCTEGFVISNGKLVAFEGYSVSDFIPVYDGSKLYINRVILDLSGAIPNCFDADKNYLGECEYEEISYGVYAFTPLKKTAYIRTTVYNTQLETKQIYTHFYPNDDVIREVGAIVYKNLPSTHNEIHNHITNTYNVTASPTITTDTNNYLSSTGDTTDRSSDIASMLTQNGICNLGVGVFYVKNITMPVGSRITGCGYKTKVILSSDADAVYCFKMMSQCSISNLFIAGSSTAIATPTEVGNRHGIMFEGEANLDSPTYIVTNCMIDTVWIEYFTGGGITCRNTGYSHSSSINVNDCIIRGCGVGINIERFSEYHRFTNVNTYNNFRGCINNGGNNMFVNCGFTGNTIGFLMDNTGGDLLNAAHGSVLGCTFNHSDGNNGVGIKIINMSNGFIFSGCQVFYSKIELTDASGLVFDSFNFGYDANIAVTNGGLIAFNGCVFGNTPTISVTNNQNVKFKECYTHSGASVQ